MSGDGEMVTLRLDVELAGTVAGIVRDHTGEYGPHKWEEIAPLIEVVRALDPELGAEMYLEWRDEEQQ